MQWQSSCCKLCTNLSLLQTTPLILLIVRWVETWWRAPTFVGVVALWYFCSHKIFFYIHVVVMLLLINSGLWMLHSCSCRLILPLSLYHPPAVDCFRFRMRQNLSSSQIHSPLLGEHSWLRHGVVVPARQPVLYPGGQVLQPYAGVNFISQSGTMNLATGRGKPKKK